MEESLRDPQQQGRYCVKQRLVQSREAQAALVEKYGKANLSGELDFSNFLFFFKCVCLANTPCRKKYLV